MLGQRVLTAVVLLAAFVAALWWLPRLAWGGLLAVVVACAAAEWGRLAGLAPRANRVYALAIAAAAVALLLGVPEQGGYAQSAPLFLNTTFWILVALPVLARPSRPLTRAQVLLCGAVVLIPTYWACVLLHAHPRGMLIVLCVVWIADTAAYFCGRRWGRRKLAPAISPGKTWEGVAGAMLAVAVYAWAMQPWVAQDFPPLAGARWVALAFALATLGIIGDLFESWLKRRAQVKDSGRLLPGHGGVLDRLDALTAALPLAALVVTWPG
ncbi:MAG: phosphatidate cytidylyltransferase [Burkholderiales bacterium]